MKGFDWQNLVGKILEDFLLSQSELAELCRVSQQAVSSWKNGRRVPGIYARRKLLEIIKDSAGKSIESHRERPSDDRIADCEERNKALISALPDLLFIHTADGIFLDFVMNSPNAFPIDPSYYIGRSMKAYLPPQIFEELLSAFRRILSSGEMEVREYSLSLGGSKYCFEARMVKYGHGKVLTVARDITEKKNIEDIKNDLNMIMHHDLKAPLCSIVGIPGILEQELSHLMDSRHLGLLHSIREAGSHMADTVNNAINIFRMEQGVFELVPENINVIPVIKRINEHLSLLLKIHKTGIVLAIDGEIVPFSSSFIVRTEELLFYSLASNLIKNAVENSTQGCDVVIAFSRTDRGIVMEVINRGLVSEKIKDRFFEKFVSSRGKKGSGIGTYSAKLIAEAHGGSISMESTEKDGTVLRIILPA
ncbi:MAG: hypothetical protein A2020_12405 [Lentisphaerae bacterium GWF2_45_14]|nr:MAG: hypothetical protein A2020_12405 [Lentisphaerae bacterium GWF2_45_14]